MSDENEKPIDKKEKNENHENEKLEIIVSPWEPLSKSQLQNISFPLFHCKNDQTGEEDELDVQAMIDEHLERESRIGTFTNKRNKK